MKAFRSLILISNANHFLHQTMLADHTVTVPTSVDYCMVHTQGLGDTSVGSMSTDSPMSLHDRISDYRDDIFINGAIVIQAHIELQFTIELAQSSHLGRHVVF